jgi:hypothetical protein
MECQYCKQAIENFKALRPTSSSLEARTIASQCDLCYSKLCNTDYKKQKVRACKYMKDLSKNQITRAKILDERDMSLKEKLLNTKGKCYAKSLATYTRIQPSKAQNYYPQVPKGSLN